MRLNDAVFGVLLILLGAAVLVHVQGFPTIPGQKYGPAIFPGVVGAGLAICGGALVLKGWRARAPLITLAPGLRSGRHLAAVVIVVGGVALYILFADAIGFLLISPLFLAALLWAFGTRLAVLLPTALLGTVVIHLGFYKLLKVPLPWGLLKSWAF